MNKTLNIIIQATLVVVVGGIVSCGDEKPPAPQSQVVKQKIDRGKVKAEPAKKAAAPKADVGTPPKSDPAAVKAAGQSDPPKTTTAPSKKGEPAPSKAVGEKPGEKTVAETSELIKASLEMAPAYDPTGRIDPFSPLFGSEPVNPVVKSKTGKKKKRVPQTPLEKVSLTQLKLTAIMRMPQGNRALVEDATGKGYVVQKGTYMGLNAGQVIIIEKDSLTVEEEIQDMVGDYIINNTVLKLQKPAGEK